MLVQDESRPIRRVRSPSRPRAWLSSSYKPKFGGRIHRPRYILFPSQCAVFPVTTEILTEIPAKYWWLWWLWLFLFLSIDAVFRRDDHSFYKPGFSNHRYHHFNHRGYFHRRDYFHPKLHHITLREREREKEKERYEQRESADGSSPPKQSNSKFMSAAEACENNMIEKRLKKSTGPHRALTLFQSNIFGKERSDAPSYSLYSLCLHKITMLLFSGEGQWWKASVFMSYSNPNHCKDTLASTHRSGFYNIISYSQEHNIVYIY